MEIRRTGLVAISIFAIGLVILCAYAIIVQHASSETVIVSGPVSSQGRATVVDTITVNGLAIVPPNSKLSINIPIYRDYADNGFAQSITWQPPVPSPEPAITEERADAFGNRYMYYEWALDNSSGSTFTATVTTTFDYRVTSDPRPGIFSDPFPVSVTGMNGYLQSTAKAQSDDASIHSKAVQLTASSASQADAVNAIMDFVRTQLSVPLPASNQAKDAVSSLSSNAGNCGDRANLALALLRSAGIPARLVIGMVAEQPYSIQYISDNAEYTRTFGWGNELHVWVEVYYPQEGWVPYDPGYNKGFVDMRHIMSGTAIDTNALNPATGGELYFVHLFANPGSSGRLSNSLTFTGVQDTGQYTFRALDPAPAGLPMIGRDMTARPTVTPGPTPTPAPAPTPTPVPVATPVVNATITPLPNATATPTPLPPLNATVSPSPVPSGTAVHNDTNVSGDTGRETYNVTGKAVDASSMAALNAVTLSIDGKQVRTNADGTFSLDVTNGTHVLTASAPGYGTASFTLAVAGADVLQDIQLSRAASGSTGGKSGFAIPGFGLAIAIAGLLIVVLYRYGRV